MRLFISRTDTLRRPLNTRDASMRAIRSTSSESNRRRRRWSARVSIRALSRKIHRVFSLEGQNHFSPILSVFARSKFSSIHYRDFAVFNEIHATSPLIFMNSPPADQLTFSENILRSIVKIPTSARSQLFIRTNTGRFSWRKFTEACLSFKLSSILYFKDFARQIIWRPMASPV